MGRSEEKLSGAQILYPLMQCCDIFHLNADICQLGVDQRKVFLLVFTRVSLPDFVQLALRTHKKKIKKYKNMFTKIKTHKKKI